MCWKHAVLVLALVLIPGSIHAQRVVLVNTGLAVPFGELNDACEMGSRYAADFYLGMSDRFPRIRWGGRIAYNSFGDTSFKSFGSTASSAASIVEIVPSLLLVLNSPDNPNGYFIQAGAGMFITSLDFRDIPGTDDDTTFRAGLTIGGGYTHRFTGWLYGVITPLYHFTDKNFLSVTAGLQFTSRDWPIVQ
jgi:hypothetical protein